MNVFQKLAKSAENRHGLELQATQVQELVATMQAMQYQIANDQGRLEAQTRILAVALNQIGGSLDIAAELFSEAENYVIDVEWNDEGDTIRASLRLADVVVPEVQEEDSAATDSTGDAVPLHTDEDGDEVDGEADEDGEE
jgi:hypothetical protein